MRRNTRRSFLRTSLAAGAAAGLTNLMVRKLPAAEPPGSQMQLGLVTYLWGRDWDVPTLIANCEEGGMAGVELRTEHAHGVEPELNHQQRAEVKRRFAESSVVLVGLGTNQAYHYTDPKQLRRSIERTKEFIKLSHDVGGLGVKVKPNDLPPDVPEEKTIEQIGRSLNEVAAFAADYGQTIRLEVHGSCSPLPIIKRIFDVATHPNVGACWNSNGQDLQGEGIVHNFNLVKERLADTVHVRELDVGDYPYQTLFDLLVGIDYGGWILLECRTNPRDRIAALKEQRAVWQKMIARAQAKV